MSSVLGDMLFLYKLENSWAGVNLINNVRGLTYSEGPKKYRLQVPCHLNYYEDIDLSFN
jgi:hypothetical protein